MGKWPVRKNKFRVVIHDVMKKFHQWWSELAVEPTKEFGNWCRHIWREFNTEADKLANKGKQLLENTSVIWENPCARQAVYLRGFWDGACTTGDGFVGVGWLILGANALASNGQPLWEARPLMTGYGRCAAHSAIAAELLAFDCLVHSLDNILLGQAVVDHEYLPWKAGGLCFEDVKPQMPNEWVHIKREKRDTDFISEDGSMHEKQNSSPTHSCSSHSEYGDNEFNSHEELMSAVLAPWQPESSSPEIEICEHGQ